MILAIFVISPVFSQETVQKKSQKKVVLKIISDDNGKTTVIDTIMEVPDSAMIDSVKEEIDKVILVGKGGKHARVKIHKMPEGFNYDFEIPSPPECPMGLEELEEFDCEVFAPGCDMEDRILDRRAPGLDRRVQRLGGHGQTLSDILGDIPMERVTSYSIKDRKNGKRIIIDLNDAPMFDNQERVIVIREPIRRPVNRNYPERRVKVDVNVDDDVKLDRTPPPPPPPPSVPPPPPSQQDKTSIKKPKI